MGWEIIMEQKKLTINIFTYIIIIIFMTLNVNAMQPTVDLGTAKDFGILAATAITNTGDTIIDKNIGLSPNTNSSITGFFIIDSGPGIVNGTIHSADLIAAQAQLDLKAAYNDAAGRSSDVVIIPSGELGNLILTPGLYRSGISSFAISAGDLTLNALGNPNAVFIFQMPSSSLTTTSGRTIFLVNEANSCNIFWQVGSSATIGTDSVFKGNILALTSITLTTNANLEGSALARNGAVTLDSNKVFLTCKNTSKNTSQSNSTNSTNPSLICGDGIISPGEQCDASNDNGKVCYAQCGTSCTYCSNSCKKDVVKGRDCPHTPPPSNGVPEFPSITILIAVLVASLGIVILRRK